MIISEQIAAIDVAKRAFYLAYEACGGTSGSGWIQAVDKATEEEVWQNALVRGDYPGRERRKKELSDQPKQAYGDYVFGRMMKLTLRWDNETNEIEISEAIPRADYQSWCRKYPSYKALIDAAIESLNQ